MIGLSLSVFDHSLSRLLKNHDSLLRPKKLTSCLRLDTKKPQRFSISTKRYKYVRSQSSEMVETSRRSAHYHPTIWDHNLIESIQSPYMDVEFEHRIEELKHEVKVILQASEEPFQKLRIIDSIKRLGVAYHFENEIENELNRVYADGFESLSSLHETSLCFRLLRQHGHIMPCDVFKKFREGDGGFKACLSQDARGLLNLYEASHLAFPGEKILEEAKEFSVGYLSKLKESTSMDLDLAEQVEHSLQIPLHWRMPRLEARYYIDVYEREEGRSSVLLELAKLDYNVTQSMHQEEIKELSRWWRALGLGEKNIFSRDRLLENYLWAVGITFEPRFSECRKTLTKLICILTVIDDIYDIYGSLEELHLLTTSVNSFDIDALENQSGYLKLIFLALGNFVNETAYYFLKDHSWDVMPFIKNEWKCLCEAYLKEAEWFYKGYKPTFEEYMENAWISVGGPVNMVHAYFFTDNAVTRDPISRMEMVNGAVHWASLIARLNDDLGTSKVEMERGDNPKSVECYMNSFGVSENASREFINSLLSSFWKELNKESVTNLTHPRSFINMVLNMARASQCIFQYGDGIGTSTGVTKERIISLFIDTVPMK